MAKVVLLTVWSTYRIKTTDIGVLVGYSCVFVEWRVEVLRSQGIIWVVCWRSKGPWGFLVVLTQDCFGWQVKVPEDNVGWEWLDVVGAVETGHGNGKYKAVVTQSWQKEVDVSCGGSTPVMKSRTTQMWDASISNGNAATLHATESISNTKYGPLNTGNGSMVDTRMAVLKSYGQSQSYRGASMASDLGSPMSGQFYTASTHESLSRGQGNMGPSTFQSMSHSGHVAMNNGHNFINDGSQRYPWAGQQVNSGSRSGKGANHVASRLSEGQESRMRENDIASSFELRLGQPSQQTQAAGASFSSMATSSVEHPKSYLFEQIMNKGC
jgi:hypothetical protein